MGEAAIEIHPLAGGPHHHAVGRDGSAAGFSGAPGVEPSQRAGATSTEIPLVTAFGEPIVETPGDALDTAKKIGLSAVYFGVEHNMLIKATI